MDSNSPPGQGSMKRLSSFGRAISGDCQFYEPRSEEEVFNVFQHAKAVQRKVVLRGAGRSYGDASIAQEQIAISLTQMNAVLNFDPSTGIIEVQGGLSLLELCRYAVNYGYWPPVVSGTSRTTVAGAVACNIHGKNQSTEGTFCEHCLEYRMLSPDGTLHTISAHSELGQSLPGNLGLFGVLISVKMKLKRAPSPVLNRQRITFRTWEEHFAAMSACHPRASALVGWIDAFADGAGTLEVGYDSTEKSGLEKPPHLPLGPGPHSLAATLGPHLLRFAIGKNILPLANAVRRRMDRVMGSKAKPCDLFRFHFQLDWLWDWDSAYLPGSLVQFQATVPAVEAGKTFPSLIDLCRKKGFPPTLVVMKHHRPGIGLLDYLVDGYSLAIDLNQKPGTQTELIQLYRNLADIAISVGGKIYLAKDFLMTSDQFARSQPTANLAQFKEIRRKMDPELQLTSGLAVRLNL